MTKICRDENSKNMSWQKKTWQKSEKCRDKNMSWKNSSKHVVTKLLRDKTQNRPQTPRDKMRDFFKRLFLRQILSLHLFVAETLCMLSHILCMHAFALVHAPYFLECFFTIHFKVFFTVHFRVFFSTWSFAWKNLSKESPLKKIHAFCHAVFGACF